MRKIIYLLFVLFSFSVEAQQCGTEPDENYQTYENEDATSSVNLANQNFCINVFFRIVRDDNGMNGFSSSEVASLFSTISPYFSIHQILLINVGYDVINNTAFNNETTPYTQPPLIPNAINIFIKRKIISNGVQVAGIAMSSTQCRITQGSVEAIKDILAHELGHNLNLLHTFQCYAPTYTSSCAEPINPTQEECENLGDMICDTPADPLYCQSTNSQNPHYCSGVDITQYHPDKKNFMTEPYTGYERDHFTEGQGERMRKAILYKPTVQTLRSNQCSRIIGSTSICPNGNQYEYSIEAFGSPITYLWSVSPKLQIVGSNNGSTVLVKTVNQNTIGNATIQLQLNGIIKTITIYIGTPTVGLNSQVVGITDWVARGTGNKGLIAPTHASIKHYVWKIIPDPVIEPICDWSVPILPKFINSNTMTYESDFPTAIVNWGNCRGSYNITCTGTNACGEINLTSRYVDVGDPVNNPCAANALQLIPFPNPVSYHAGLHFNVIKEPILEPCDYILDYNNQFYNRRLDLVSNELEIYDFNATLVFSKVFETNDFTIEDLDLPPGNYVVNLLTNEKKFIQQVIIVENR